MTWLIQVEMIESSALRALRHQRSTLRRGHHPLQQWTDQPGRQQSIACHTASRLPSLRHSICSVSAAELSHPVCNIRSLHNKSCKRKGKVDLYGTSSRTPLTRSDMDHTVLPANDAISAFTRKHSPGGASTHKHIPNAWVQLTTHLSTPRGWMAEFTA